jgi:hypothetical protein
MQSNIRPTRIHIILALSSGLVDTRDNHQHTFKFAGKSVMQKNPTSTNHPTRMDPLRDDSLIYEHILREEYGIPTKLSVYSGIPHAGNDFLPMLSQAKQSAKDVVTGAKWLLDQVSK